jgi:hypothetical protein
MSDPAPIGRWYVICFRSTSPLHRERGVADCGGRPRIERVEHMEKDMTRIGNGFRLFACAALAAALPLIAQAQRPQSAQDTPDDAVRTIDHAVAGYVSDDALHVQYERELRIEDFGPLEARVGVFYNEDRDLIATVDALTRLGETEIGRNLRVRVGTRAYGAFLNVENQDIFGMSVGGEAEYFFSRDGGTSIALTAFYAPDILTFGEADNFTDVSLRLQTRLRQGTDLFVGVRSFEIDTTLGDREVDDNLHVGFRRSF